MASLDAKTVAIVRFGAIGREAAQRLRAFGARLIGVSRTAAPDSLLDQAAPASQLDAVLTEADAVLISLPLTNETRGLFDAQRLQQMKQGALLVNIARGAIVDSHALAEALQSGRLGGAGIDVTDPEPLPPDHPLWRAPNLIVTPHVAAQGGYRRLGEFVAENVKRFLRGEPLEAIVVLKPGS